uniref:hypothetical protein n=1 Tax=Nocardia suismassiliense TaxID=2077092 RepID=UPI003F4912F6
MVSGALRWCQRERAKAAVAQVDSNLNAHVVAFMRWLVHETDELPSRLAAPTS